MGGFVTEESEVIGLFDLDHCSVAKSSRDFLKKQEEQQNIRDCTEDLPNSFLLCRDGIILSSAPSRSLAKRMETQERRKQWQKTMN